MVPPERRPARLWDDRASRSSLGALGFGFQKPMSKTLFFRVQSVLIRMFNSRNFELRVSTPRNIAYSQFDMCFECSNLPGAGPIFSRLKTCIPDLPFYSIFPDVIFLIIPGYVSEDWPQELGRALGHVEKQAMAPSTTSGLDFIRLAFTV